MNTLEVTDNIRIEDLIYEVRGKQVMLDFDLARIYHCKNGTKEVNQAVKNNLEKFPERFSWVLSDNEYNILRSKILTANGKFSNKKRFNPRVFTEEGCLMISTILKTKIANDTIIAIMDAFVTMKNYLSNSLLEQNFYKNMLLDHDDRIKILESNFNNKTFSNEIFFDGEVYDAYSLLLNIINGAKDSIIVIDNYLSKELLDILSETNKNIVVYSKNLNNTLISKYNSQYNNVTFKKDNRFHDRFIIIDKKEVYHSGASFKDLGKKCFAINKIVDKDMINNLLNRL